MNRRNRRILKQSLSFILSFKPEQCIKCKIYSSHLEVLSNVQSRNTPAVVPEFHSVANNNVQNGKRACINHTRIWLLNASLIFSAYSFVVEYTVSWYRYWMRNSVHYCLLKYKIQDPVRLQKKVYSWNCLDWCNNGT